ncbi:MAG TPA: hypothetical protein VIM61_06235 [Chthoniobacterales bacterium]
MSPSTILLLSLGGSLVISALMLVVFGLFLRAHFTKLLRESERRIYGQLNGEDGLRARIERLDRAHGRLLEAREDLRRQGKELEKQRRAAHALTQVARGLTQTSIQNLERFQEVDRRIHELKTPEP